VEGWCNGTKLQKIYIETLYAGTLPIWLNLAHPSLVTLAFSEERTPASNAISR
jgi:hypothetical protein